MTDNELDRRTTVGLRVDDANPGHTRVSVFAGRTPGARGHSGHLVFRSDEWADIMEAIGRARRAAHEMQHPCTVVVDAGPEDKVWECDDCGERLVGLHAMEKHRLLMMMRAQRDAIKALLPDIIDRTTVDDVDTGGLL